MTVLRSIVVAFASFSKIPMPQVEWREDSMRYAMCFFPWIGLVIGAVAWCWLEVCGLLSAGSLLWAAGVTLIPLAVTGGIHYDGFADVIDAQSSHAEAKRKREILKDPHTGAFAIIGIASYLVVYLALASELPQMPLAVALLCCMHWESRCLSGIATVSFPKSSSQGMLATFSGSADKRISVAVLVAEWVLGACAMVWLSPVAGASMAVAGLLVLAWLYRFAMKQFRGMSGDLAGFFLQVAELVMLACLVVALRLA